MTKPNFSPAKADRILELATRYYDLERESYTGKQLYEAGIEVDIPEHLIRRAISDLDKQELQQLERQRKTRSLWRIGFGAGISFIGVIALWTGITYNHLTILKLATQAAQQQVDNQDRRRAELIPQLIDLTERYGDRQEKLLTQLIQAQQSYLTAVGASDKQLATAKLDRAVRDFSEYAVANQRLNSSQLYINLQYEITGTANRIAVERQRRDRAVAKYNESVGQLPQSFVARTFQFTPLPFSGSE